MDVAWFIYLFVFPNYPSKLLVLDGFAREFFYIVLTFPRRLIVPKKCGFH